ncbi:hypothetical protein [Burkholderia ubonensis]|uniref:hypothetical protein n=1 Tax=Burkholderia ubonensis TaxID=101571 RepID=UPI00075F928B|nr:hypothetical protein [Burkholderia ubonensis]KWO75948.1 hypothetical protein WM31_04710 [Burkholderia ubonensis]
MTKNRSASGFPITGREPYTLSPERLDEATIAAESGDPASAESLYLHYSFGEYDRFLSERWRLTAATLGSTRAQRDLAVALMDARSPDLIQGDPHDADDGSR